MENPSLQIGDNNWAVKDGSILGYNIIQDNYLPQPIDFTRASTATRVNAEGLIETASILGSELITNGSFATDTDWTKGTGWTISGGEANFNTTANAFLSQSGSYVGGKTYKVLIDVVSYTRGNPFIAIGQGSQFNIPTTIGSHTLYVVSGGVDTLLRIYSGIFGVGGQGSIDNVSIKEVITSNIPRIDYSTGSPSLLLEPQRTNIVLNNNDFSAGTWGLTLAASLISNNVISPDGTLNADTLVAGVGGAQIQQAQTGTSGTVYTVSMYMKRISGSGAVYLRAVENTNTPVTITNEWTRVSLTVTSTTATIRVGVRLDISGDQVAIWGAQVELGSYSTSLIPTSGTAVTRVADRVSRSGLGLTDSTFVLNFRPLNYTVEVFDFQKSGGGRMFYVAVLSNGFITFNSVSGGTIGALGSPITLNETCKLAFTLNASTSNIVVFINGLKIGTYATDITTFDRFRELETFGFVQGTKVEQILIFPSVLTDAQCIELTTL